MRLIDAGALRNEYCKDCSVDCRDSCKYDPLCGTMMWVNEAPTIDAVPVVRCKDCEYNSEHKAIGEDGLWCDYWAIDPDENDFCSYGERRSEC